MLSKRSLRGVASPLGATLFIFEDLLLRSGPEDPAQRLGPCSFLQRRATLFVMTIALSTQHFTDHPDHSALDLMAPLGFQSIFLGAGLWPNTIKRVRKRERHTSALTIFAERPFGLRWDEDPLQKWPLLTTDRELRQRLIAEASKSLLFAADLEVERVVVPLLTTEDDSPRRLLLDAARLVLEPLLDEAYRRKARLCVSIGKAFEASKNPTLPQESNQSIPAAQELMALFKTFSGAPMSYWHKAKQKKQKRQAPQTRAQREAMEEREPRPSGGILLVSSSSLPFELSSYNPETAAIMAAHGESLSPKLEVTNDTSLWTPKIEEGFVALCGGVEITAHQPEAFLEYQTEQLWVVI